MIDHIGLPVTDVEASKALYTAALSSLGYAVEYEDADSVGLGVDGTIDLWLYKKPGVTLGTHLAFVASSRDQVDRFHANACASGAGDNGRPGIRADYAANYYAAFVLDADGHNIEVVCYAE